MINYNITLSQAEDLALAYCAKSQQEWIDNAVHERCRVAMDAILKIALDKSIETETTLPTSREEIVLLAFERGWFEKAADIKEPSIPLA